MNKNITSAQRANRTNARKASRRSVNESVRPARKAQRALNENRSSKKQLNKQALYESIMKKVAKEVKKSINEAYAVTLDPAMDRDMQEFIADNVNNYTYRSPEDLTEWLQSRSGILDFVELYGYMAREVKMFIRNVANKFGSFFNYVSEIWDENE